MSQKWFYFVIIFSVIISACAPLGGTLEVGVIPETQDTTEEITSTPTTSSPTQIPEPIQSTGIVMGKICYPSEFIPSMTAYFQNAVTDEFTQMQVAENQDNYTRSNSSPESMLPSFTRKRGRPHWAACIPQQFPAGYL